MIWSAIFRTLLFLRPAGLGGFAGAGFTLLGGELFGSCLPATSAELRQVLFDGVSLHKLHSSTCAPDAQSSSWHAAAGAHRVTSCKRADRVLEHPISPNQIAFEEATWL